MRNDDLITFVEATLYGMKGESPSKAIENQEKRGQQSVVRNKRLPKRTNAGLVPEDIRWNGKEVNIEYTKQQYEKMGITIVEEYDDLFWNVELPAGWEIKATEHSMWNDLLDEKGRIRATFFYKAAFYDRDAFMNFNTRFNLYVGHVVGISSGYEVWEKSDYQGTVKDGEEIIFSTERIAPTGDYWKDNNIQNRLRKQLEKYMKEHYPNYKDINSYWDINFVRMV